MPTLKAHCSEATKARFQALAQREGLNTLTHRLLRSGQFAEGMLDLQALAQAVERLRREVMATTTRASHRAHCDG